MIGVFSKTTDSSFVEAVGLAGLDFIILDQEHGAVSREKLYDHIRAAKVGNIKSIVRVAELNHNLIGSALDAGADGIQVPNISNATQAKEAIRAARFHPLGMRGICRFVKAASFGDKNKNAYFQESNEKMLILQIEGKEGVESLEEILDLEGYDVLFIGPYDLSQSLGLPGQVDHPIVLKTIEEIVSKAKKAKKIIGSFSDNFEMFKKLKNCGIDYLSYSVDVNIFLEACKSVKINLSDKF